MLTLNILLIGQIGAPETVDTSATAVLKRWRRRSAGVDWQGMESLNAEVFTYNWIPSRIVSIYRESQSGRFCLVDRARRIKTRMEDLTDRGSVSRTGWTSQSGRHEDWRKFEEQTNYETLTAGN